MAELSNKERLQPSLLDRLSDNERDSAVESRERRVLSPARLRESVRRDLAWLLNASNMESAREGIAGFPAVQTSVVNYGIPALAGKTASDVDIGSLERAVREAVWRFEPRLIRSSVRVTTVEPGKKEETLGRYNLLSFYIDAMLWAQPIPLRLFLRTDVDLELGVVRVTELS